VRRAAIALAREVERRVPDLATSKWWKEERHGVFIDYNQNAKDRTVASAWSVRPTPDARVSMPLQWDEVAGCDPAAFTSSRPRAVAGRRPSGDRRAPAADGLWSSRPPRDEGLAMRVAANTPRRRPAAARGLKGRRARALVEIGRAAKQPTPSPASSGGRRATPTPGPTSARPTSWSTRCAAAPRRGLGSASTWSTSRPSCGPPRSRSTRTTTRGDPRKPDDPGADGAPRWRSR
jgi:hypothetical protein